MRLISDGSAGNTSNKISSLTNILTVQQNPRIYKNGRRKEYIFRKSLGTIRPPSQISEGGGMHGTGKASVGGARRLRVWGAPRHAQHS